MLIEGTEPITLKRTHDNSEIGQLFTHIFSDKQGVVHSSLDVLPNSKSITNLKRVFNSTKLDYLYPVFFDTSLKLNQIRLKELPIHLSADEKERLLSRVMSKKSK